MSETAEVRDVTLHYFAIRGKAEPIRLQFEESGIPYKDVRIPRADWYQTEKQLYHSAGKTPFDQLPVVSVKVSGQETETFLCQSIAIHNFFARSTGFYGGSPLEMYQIDMVACGCEDWRSEYTRVVYNKDFDNVKTAYIQLRIPHYLGIFEKLLSENSSSGFFFAGSKASFADCLVYELLDLSQRLAPSCLGGYNLLSKFYTAYQERPRVAAYLASGRRPEQVNNSTHG